MTPSFWSTEEDRRAARWGKRIRLAMFVAEQFFACLARTLSWGEDPRRRRQ